MFQKPAKNVQLLGRYTSEPSETTHLFGLKLGLLRAPCCRNRCLVSEYEVPHLLAGVYILVVGPLKSKHFLPTESNTDTKIYTPACWVPKSDFFDILYNVYPDQLEIINSIST